MAAYMAGYQNNANTSYAGAASSCGNGSVSVRGSLACALASAISIIGDIIISAISLILLRPPKYLQSRCIQ